MAFASLMIVVANALVLVYNFYSMKIVN